MDACHGARHAPLAPERRAPSAPAVTGSCPLIYHTRSPGEGVQRSSPNVSTSADPRIRCLDYGLIAAQTSAAENRLPPRLRQLPVPDKAS
ncbi:hypothetical protein EYF80_054638 [Liparis tanakae]|uniref:Uncharacterized protein n=1 Tax=Liparis tanakae TaxID=230148 RepID=A0A4Z2F2B9_9TELE|nr:hypothetical protein EYF80_054638 [Liparis tanakae]